MKQCFKILLITTIFLFTNPVYGQVNITDLIKPRVDQKIIALTFDDGPHPTNTPLILDELKKRQIKATFYLIGSNAKRHQAVVKQIADEGHEIGNHSFTHRALTECDKKTIFYEILETSKIIKEIAGQAPKSFRPPGGRYNDQVIAEATNYGLSTILWTIDPADWRSRNVNYITREISKIAKNGDVILLHDIHFTTTQVVPKVLDNLTDQGFKFVTIEELIEINNQSKDSKLSWKK